MGEKVRGQAGDNVVVRTPPGQEEPIEERQHARQGALFQADSLGSILQEWRRATVEDCHEWLAQRRSTSRLDLRVERLQKDT